MNSYLQAIEGAVLLFPFVALVFTLPYMLVQYRKYGAILLLRAAIVYSFILYMMCAYFLTMLPLPDVEAVRGMTSSRYQLIPFKAFFDLFKNPKIIWAQPATYYHFFWSTGFFQIAANVAMTVPFGIYLRYYFHCGLRKTLLLSLALSLSFELIQLSGLFFIYPRPYRLCEVDDLITNTLGGVIGWRIAPVFMKLLPSREHMDEVAYRKGTHVSITRRAFAALMDGLLLSIFAAVLLWLFRGALPAMEDPLPVLWFCFGVYAVGIALYFMLGEWLWKGRTPGKLLTHLKLIDIRDGGRPKLWQCVVRYGVLYWVVLPTPAMILTIFMIGGQYGSFTLLMILTCLLLLLVYILFWLLLAVHVFTHSINLLHGKLSMTRNVNTLYLPRTLHAVGRQTHGFAKRENARATEK
ncbi:MAG: VanZ family protein [Clostridia bacterium]